MPKFTAEIIISFCDLNHNESMIPKYSKMQECTRFEMFREKKRKKERKKKGKAPRLGFESSSTRQGFQICGVSSINYEWSLLFLTRRASCGALTSALFHFLSFFLLVYTCDGLHRKGKDSL